MTTHKVPETVEKNVIAFTRGYALSRRLAELAQEAGVEWNAVGGLAEVAGCLEGLGPGAIVISIADVEGGAAPYGEMLNRRAPGTPIIAILERKSSIDAARLIRMGISECLGPEATADDIFRAVCKAFTAAGSDRAPKSTPEVESWRKQLVGNSCAMEQVTRVIRLIAPRRCTVLISGETGTGKEMAARAIHLAGDRARRPMVAVNCGAIPENLIEAELFGHVKGAFTGAVANRMGRFEQANGGTIFLDEIGDLPFDLQAKLLRVLQEREIQRLGNAETVKLDVRVIAATNSVLLTSVQNGKFREDLYYRLNVAPIQMPALRERIDDIPLLVKHFIQKVCSAEGLTSKTASPEAMQSLCAYAWPGNVRQLENIVEQAIVMNADDSTLPCTAFSLPRSATPRSIRPFTLPGSGIPDDGLDFSEALRQFERAILHQALTRTQGNKTLAADMLRLPRTTLIHKLRALDPVA